MTISLNREVIEKYKLTVEESVALLIIINNLNICSGISSLLDKGLIGQVLKDNKPTSECFATNEAKLLLESIILDSDRISGSNVVEDRISKLVPALQEIYPEGRKEGTNKYWRGNKIDIKKKLQSFIKKYGEDYSNEIIINATKAYVSSFNGRYTFMRLLQYFIWKEEIKDGIKIASSDLASFIENLGSNDSNEDWTSEAR